MKAVCAICRPTTLICIRFTGPTTIYRWPIRWAPAAIKEQGKIRAIGVSNFAVRDLSEMLALSECETNQLPYSLLWRVIEREIQPLCAQNDVGIICYSSLAQGLLTGRYHAADEVPDGLARTVGITTRGEC